MNSRQPNDAYWHWIQLIAPEGAFAEAFERAIDNITSDGFDYGDIVSIDEIMDAAANPIQPVSDWGVTSATSYVGPNFGVPIEWESRLTTRKNLAAIDAPSDLITLGRKFGPYNDAEVDISIHENTGMTARFLVEDTAEVLAARDLDVILQHDDGNRGFVLWRIATQDKSLGATIHYEEFHISDDESGWVIAQTEAPLMDGDDIVFGKWFGPLVGAVTINGGSYGEVIDVDELFAAAQSPI